VSTTTSPIARRTRIGLLIGTLGATALLAAGLPGLGAANQAAADVAARAITIKIASFAFAPKDLTIAAGTTVTWENQDEEVHRLAAVDNGFSSPALDNSDSYSHTFATPGVYKYICSIHPYMVGRVIVKPAGKSS
jgi:plastocyanin